MISIAVMGHGTVGSGVVEVLLKNTEIINKRVKNEIEVKHILDLREFNDLPYADKFTKDFNVILNDPYVKVVAEVMGGINPAYDFVKRCLLAGKSVVTSNKELVAAKGDELLRIAEENNVNFLFLFLLHTFFFVTCIDWLEIWHHYTIMMWLQLESHCLLGVTYTHYYI